MVSVTGFAGFEEIGRGAFSTVYRARQLEFGRDVAVKILQGSVDDADERASFEREIRAMGAVSEHPHIATVLSSAISDGGQPCIIVEYFGRGTLADEIEGAGALEPAAVLDLGVKIAGALQTAHDRGVLHQDIKPQNIFMSDFGQPALGDFGISLMAGDSAVGGLTLHYASPERVTGRPATAQSDVYALAATLYRAAAGRRPFEAPATGQSREELVNRIMHDEPPRLHQQWVPESLQETLFVALAKEPSRRPASAASFGRELQRTQHELGFSVTDLLIEGSDAHGDTPWDPAPSSSDAAETAANGSEGEHESTAGATGAAPLSRRVASMVGASIAVGLAIALFVFASGRESEPERDPTVDIQDAILGELSPPERLRVVRIDETLVRVSWTPLAGSDEVVTYRVRGADDLSSVVSIDGSFIDIDHAPDRGAACFDVRSVTESGRLSAPSAIVCEP